ncbi:MAG: class I SAM-dependent methyltransferase, partial [Burkholderiaceae bacterium]
MNYDLLIDLHKGNPRQGPGSPQLTKRALELAGIDCAQHVHIADIGCGTGSSTLVLAEHLNASIVAVDLFQAFLDGLSLRAQ